MQNIGLSFCVLGCDIALAGSGYITSLDTNPIFCILAYYIYYIYYYNYLAIIIIQNNKQKHLIAYNLFDLMSS